MREKRKKLRKVLCVLGLNSAKHLFEKALEEAFDSFAHADGSNTVPVINIAHHAADFAHQTLNLLMGLTLEEEILCRGWFDAIGSARLRMCRLGEERELVAAAVEGCFEGWDDDACQGGDFVLGRLRLLRVL